MRVYAGQQDNSTISVYVHSPPAISSTEHWLAVGGSECADVAVDPRDPNIVYATSYSGEITYMNRSTGEVREVTAYPHYTEGTEQRDLKYRWQWNFPIFISQYQPDVIYQGSNYVMRSEDQGHSWQIISPDLTRKLDQYHDIPGGPIQHDATGVEVYSSIFALEESPHNPGEIWVGTDDGRVHITRDGGEDWEEITPKGMPYEGTVNKIELSSHEAGRAFMVVYNYRYQDFAPYIFLTNDYGKSWEKLTDGTNGIPGDHFVRAIAEDPDTKGLLYAGTEFGMYISFDEGEYWQPFQLNLPHTPITDMEVVDKRLVLSTQGRSFWVLDDLSPLHQMETVVSEEKALLKPKSVYRSNTGNRKAQFHFYMKEQPDSSEVVSLELYNPQQQLVHMWSSQPEKETHERELSIQEGMNLVTWDLRYQGPNMVKGFVAMVMQAGKERGPMAVPGTYEIVLKAGDWKQRQRFQLLADPRWKDISSEDYQAQLDFALEVRDSINTSQEKIRAIRSIQEQASGIAERAVKSGFSSDLEAKAQSLSDKLSDIEADLYQSRIETSQDEINFPRKYSNHIARLYGVIIQGAQAPTAGMKERFEDLKEQYKQFIAPYEGIVGEDLKEFNQLLEAEGVDRILWR
ncbi:MAG: glycosyl hydrolase, partial [Bacteroidota bacterium]